MREQPTRTRCHSLSLSHLFMLTHEVSNIPMSLSTPSRMSRMTSGGMRRERISDRDSGLMLPTACFASSTKGWVYTQTTADAVTWSGQMCLDVVVWSGQMRSPGPLWAPRQCSSSALRSWRPPSPFSLWSSPSLSSGHWHSETNTQQTFSVQLRTSQINTHTNTDLHGEGDFLQGCIGLGLFGFQ